MKKSKLNSKVSVNITYIYLVLETICFCLSIIFGVILLPLAVSWKSIQCIMCFFSFSIVFFGMAITWFVYTLKNKKELILITSGSNTFNKKESTNTKTNKKEKS